MADLLRFLSDIEDDVLAGEDLSAILLLIHEDGREAFTSAEAAGVVRVLKLQAKHASSLMVKWTTAHEAFKEVARRTQHG